MSGADNKLDFVQGVALQPWEWNNLGAVFGAADNSQAVSARCSFVLRQGWDEEEGTAYGGVAEGAGDVGFSLRSGPYAFHISASNLAAKSGADAPLRASAPPGGGLAGLKLAFAQEVAADRFLGASYDFRAKKPELMAAWAGDTLTERAALLLALDPVDAALRLRAAVSFPGPEWRRDVWDHNTRKVQVVQDDGRSRHTFWVEHEMRRGQLLASTRFGARLDLGRLANWAGELLDSQVEPRLPLLLWRIPLTQRLYKLLVPGQDDEQMRYNIEGWAVEVAHDFDAKGPTLGLSKALGRSGLTAAASYDTEANAAGVELRSGWLRAGASVSRAGDGGWRAPALTLTVQPLGFL